MKIMYLLFSFTVGGTEKLVTDICNEMSRQGHNIFLYIVNQYHLEDMLRSLNLQVTVQLQNRVSGEKNIVKTMRKIEQYVSKKHIEVIHCNSFNSPELLCLTKLCHPSVRIIYTIHDVNQWCKLHKMRSIYRNMICSRIIAISKSVEHDIIQSGAKASKVSVVYNAINLSNFYPKGLNFKKGNALVIGNVARIMPDKKGQDILIHAVSKGREQYSNIKCLFAGSADEVYQKDFEDLKVLIRELELENYVKFVGNVMDVPVFLERIDLFVLPSRFEGFGISLIEAMAMGIPCIVSNLNGPAEIVGDEERGLLFPSEDVNALTEKIMYTIEHYGEMMEVAEKAAEYVSENFDIRNMCRELIQLYS